jgi:site-specific recombinase XerD
VKFTDIAAHKQMFLRHSLATFFSSNEVHPSVIQTMLRHAKPQTTARYIHSVNSKQVEAQGKYLEAIKLGNDGKEAA